MLLFSKQMWEQAHVCGWLGRAESHEHFWKNNCNCISNRWWVNLCIFFFKHRRVHSFFQGHTHFRTWLPNQSACSWRGDQMAPLDLFPMVIRKLLVLLFAPNQITKLSMHNSKGETLNGVYWAPQFWACHIMSKEVNLYNHCNLI